MTKQAADQVSPGGGGQALKEEVPLPRPRAAATSCQVAPAV